MGKILGHTILFIVSCCLVACDGKDHSESTENRSTTSNSSHPALQPDLAKFNRYVTYINAKSTMIPKKSDRDILRQYMSYLGKPSLNSGRVVIEALMAAAEKNRGKISSQWVNFFEGNVHLASKQFTMGTLSLERFLPLVEAGNMTAIELVLTYSATVKTDEADSNNLQKFEKIINENYQEKVDAIKRRNRSFFKKYPPRI